MSNGINIKFPFKTTVKGGVFDVNTTSSNALKSDLICLLTTRRGQRPMRSSLYSPIYDYIMEPLDSFVKSELKKDIEKKVSEFIPQISITAVNFEEPEQGNLLKIDITFRIDNEFITDSISITVSRDI
jgi:phage baseplate assembly protein W